MKPRWTAAENKRLIYLFVASTPQKLAEAFPGRSLDGIKLHAWRLGLSRPHPDNRLADLTILQEQTPVAAYWLGFLLADGHFSDTSRIKLKLAVQDSEHVQRFAKFIKFRGHRADPSEVSAMDVRVVSDIRARFSIRSNKTVSPASLDGFVADESFVAMVIGLIDGDGNIQRQTGRDDCAIRLKLHASWLGVLNEITERVSCLAQVVPVKATINSAGYAYLAFSNWKVVSFLKREALRLVLPVMDRKWGLIDLSRPNRLEVAAENKRQVAEMLNKGMRQKDITRVLGLSKAGVSLIAKKVRTES